MSEDQEEQTIKSFKEKWSNNKDLAFSETLKKDSNIQKWILKIKKKQFIKAIKMKSLRNQTIP